MADLGHLGFYGSNNGFFEKPMYDHSSKFLCVFEKIASYVKGEMYERTPSKHRVNIHTTSCGCSISIQQTHICTHYTALLSNIGDQLARHSTVPRLPLLTCPQ